MTCSEGGSSRCPARQDSESYELDRGYSCFAALFCMLLDQAYSIALPLLLPCGKSLMCKVVGRADVADVLIGSSCMPGSAHSGAVSLHKVCTTREQCTSWMATATAAPGVSRKQLPPTDRLSCDKASYRRCCTLLHAGANQYAAPLGPGVMPCSMSASLRLAYAGF